MPYRSPFHLFVYILTFKPFYKLGLIILSFFVTVIGLSSPIFQKLFINEMINGSFNFFWLIYSALSLLITFWGYQVLLILSVKVALKTQHELNKTLYDHLLRLRSVDLKNKTIGHLISVYTTDIPSSTILIEQSLPQGLTILFPLVLAPLALVIFFDVQVIDIVLPLIIFVIVNFLLAFRQSIFFTRFKELAGVRLGYINEWVQNIRILRMLSWINYFENKIFLARVQETNNRIRMLNNGQTMNTLSSSMTFALTLYLLWKSSVLSPGNILGIFWIVTVFFTKSFRQLPWFFTFFFDAWTSIKRIYEVLQLGLSHQVKSCLPAVNMENQIKNINQCGSTNFFSVKNLNLKINNKSILKNISLTGHMSEFIAIIGPLGSGKTLFLLSLIGETDATFEEFKIGSFDMLQLPKSEWKKFFTLTCQDNFLISSSLRDNVGFEYNLKGQVDSDIINALNLANFKIEQEGLVHALDSVIGERGVNLSGGQKQRVQIARSIFQKDAIVYLFDDCLSSLDIQTKKNIFDHLLSKKLSHKLRFLVTHNFDVLDRVDRIMLLIDGELKFFGLLKDLPISFEEIKKWKDHNP